MWYGFKNKITFKNTEKNYKKNLNLKTKSLHFNFNFKIKTNLNKGYSVFLYIPNNWNFIVYNINNEKFYLYFYSFFMYIYTIINLKKSKLIFDRKTNSICFDFKYKNVFYNLYWTYITN